MKNSGTVRELFVKNKWIRYFISAYDPEYPNQIWRQIDKKSEYYVEYYHLGDKRHRLDGPAINRVSITRRYSYGLWYVYDQFLEGFDACFSKKNKKNLSRAILRYVKNNPQYIKEVELICRYNNWLAEKELLLLNCQDMFLQ
jgi:hypothetical protein